MHPSHLPSAEPQKLTAPTCESTRYILSYGASASTIEADIQASVCGSPRRGCWCVCGWEACHRETPLFSPFVIVLPPEHRRETTMQIDGRRIDMPQPLFTCCLSYSSWAGKDERPDWHWRRRLLSSIPKAFTEPRAFPPPLLSRQGRGGCDVYHPLFPSLVPVLVP